jgi:hypothetical protein
MYIFNYLRTYLGSYINIQSCSHHMKYIALMCICVKISHLEHRVGLLFEPLNAEM